MAQLFSLRKLTALLLLPLSTALAQSVPMSAYQFSALSGTFAPLPATATNVPALLGDDVVSPLIALPFPFYFGGTAYAGVVASSNGFLAFDARAGSSLTNSLTGAGAPVGRPLVAPFWDDLNVQTSQPARASYATAGVAPNRVFTFEWLNYGRYPSMTPVLSFQVRLYETTNVVEFSYRPEAAVLPTTTTASLGLAGANTGDFLALTNTSAAPAASFTAENYSINTRPATGQIYRFTPPAAGACLPVSGLAVSAITSTSAQLRFAPAAGNTGFRVTYQVASGGAISTVAPAPAASPVTLTGLLPGTVYVASVQGLCGAVPAVATATVSFRTANLPPANDNPITAPALALASTCVPTAGTLAAATPTPANGYANPSACGNGGLSGSYDVWYRFQTAAASASGSTAVRVAVSGLRTSGTLRAFSSGSGTASGPFTDIGCRSLSGSSPLDLNALMPATTYFLSLSSGYAVTDTIGRFTICLTPTPACVPPTQLSVNTITTSSARLTLLPGNGNTAYTATYQVSAGGPGTIITSATLPIQLTGLLAGTAYRATVQVSCGSAPAGAALTTYFTTTALNAPANNEAATAVPLVIGAACAPATGTTVGATASSSPNPGAGQGCGDPTAGGALRDVWYRFTTAATPVLQNVRITVAGRAAGQVRVFDGAARIACAAGAGRNQTAPALTVANLLTSHTYTISVSGYSNTDTTGIFTICLTGLPATPSAPNDDCASATPLPVGSTCVPIQSTTVNATPSTGLTGGSCGGISPTSGDVWFRTVVPAAGALTISTSAAATGSATPLTDTVLEVYDGSCATPRFLGCNDDAGGTLYARLALAGLTPGTPLLVRVLGFSGRAGSFGICATAGAPRACTPPTGLAVTPTSATSVVVSFVAGTTASGFRLVYAPLAGGASQQLYGAVSPITLTGLLPNTQYSLSLYTSCDSIRSSSSLVVTAPVRVTFLSRNAALASASALAALVELYPNPAHTAFTLSLPAELSTKPGTFTLTNALGQVVLRRTWVAQPAALRMTVEVSQLAPGLYWLQAGPVVRRLVVE